MFLLDCLVNIYTVTATAVFVGFVALLCLIKYNYWRSKGVSGPTPLPLLGTSIDVFTQSLNFVHLKHVKKYGRIYGTYELFLPQLVIADPKLVKQICVRDFHLFTNRRCIDDFHDFFSKSVMMASDKEWKRLRKVISPTFSTAKIKRMKPLMEECISNALSYLEMIADKQEQLNLKQFWSRYTLEVIGRCCFALNINSHTDPDNEFLKHVETFQPKIGVWLIFVSALFCQLPLRYLKKREVEILPKKAFNFMSTVVFDLLKKRRANGSDENDFLQLLVEAEKESEDKSEAPLTEMEILANCMTFFTVGYDTTANFLQYFSFAMAKYPDVQEKLYEEIRSSFPDKNMIDYEVVNKLPYLDAVVSETLRMYPPVVTIERTTTGEVKIEDTGLILPANSLVQILVYAIHHDPDYHPEPEVFKPDRFLGDNKNNMDPYTYLPFGIGQRNCVAMRFALLESKLAIIRAMMNFMFVKSDKTPPEPEFFKGSVLLHCHEILVNIVKR